MNPYQNTSFLERVIGALRLDAQLYSEVSCNPVTAGQALLVLLVSGIFQGLGSGYSGDDDAVFRGVIALFIGWIMLGMIVVSIRFLLRVRRKNDSALMRTLAFALAPRAFYGFLALPGMGVILINLVHGVILVWLVATLVVALESVFVLTRRKAIVMSLLSWVMYDAAKWFFGVLSEIILQ